MRLVEIILCSVGLLLLGPLFLIVAVLIKLESRGPVFYRAPRVGRDEKMFHLYKFRTMVADAARHGPGITTADDRRITRMGRLLRKTKIDELPQLLNVLKGDMSLVGPRPEDPRYVARYTPEQRQVLRVRPGITSPASLHYRNEAELLNGPNWEQTYIENILPHKLQIEREYLSYRTIWSDLGIILKTLLAIVH